MQWTPTSFITQKDSRTPRDPGHVRKCPEYPDPNYYLNHIQKYFFRNPALRHLRPEQFNRYLALAGDYEVVSPTLEETRDDDEDGVPVDPSHRHYDKFMEGAPPGQHFLSICKGVPGCKRRKQANLGISRTPCPEPLGDRRESYYENRLILGMSWYCVDGPEMVLEDGKEREIWTFVWTPPSDEELGGVKIEPEILRLGHGIAVSFDERCAALERKFCDAEMGLVCPCCALEDKKSVCAACRHAV